VSQAAKDGIAGIASPASMTGAAADGGYPNSTGSTGSLSLTAGKACSIRRNSAAGQERYVDGDRERRVPVRHEQPCIRLNKEVTNQNARILQSHNRARKQ